MKKVLLSIILVLAVIFGGNLAVAAAANATPTSNTSSVGVAKAAPTFVTKSVTPVTSIPSRTIGNGVIKPTWIVLKNSCYNAVDGYVWCYRYSCTNWEYWFYGCRDGWYRAYPTYWEA